MAVASDAVTANAGGANDALAGVSVSETTTVGVEGAAATQEKKEKKPPADAKKQVFAGNLAFSTTEDDLRALFSQAGPVADIQIITRGSRSLGYCFITYESEDSAQKAVSTLNKQVVAGREINLEGAKPQEELAALKEAKAAQRREKNAKKKEAKEAAAAAAAPAEATETVEGSAVKKEKKKRAKKPKTAAGRRPRADDGEEADKEPAAVDGAEAAVATNGAEGTSSTAAPKKRNRKTKAQKAAAAAAANGEAAPVEGGEGTAAATATPAAEKKPRERKPRAPKGPPTGEASSTLLFAANLSFETEDEQLKEAFTSEGLQVVSATVVKRKFGLKKSKGFGFVEFADKEEQTKALEKVNGKVVGGREISLKVAIQGSKEQADAESKQEADAATTTQAPSAAA
ncbi:hypothetical protein BCV69DRAFT_314286 [Microstroma glucosiphilum]|uniref:RRM domain-containing protein n=1 Tax=Pseudomicrostroma glucosiphilum TaxID=1684307 RepID=A0A316TZU5_9BASI|nr:hypothetical protein BCV69DRAFT_314286 [Pseudomicrostroma glucosiphilum]PWN18719.1 hypothetical protein BCV69DRAFT_314286 [Pseudomicrostroma glucosiphilum]